MELSAEQADEKVRHPPSPPRPSSHPPTLTFPIPNDDVVVADAADDEEEDDVDDSLGYGDD